MINTFITTMSIQTKKGFAWKAFVQGQPDEHMMNWNGCNYKFISIRTQPRRGFAYEWEAHEFIGRLLDEFKAMELDRAMESIGSYYPEPTGNDWRDFVKRTEGLNRQH